MNSVETQQGRWGDGERGSGTVIGLAAIGVIISTLLALLMVASAVLARQQAQSAADLGSVAGAQQLKAGASADAACARARDLVEANGASVDECTVADSPSSEVGPTVRLQVSHRVAVGPGDWVARVTAHAGLVSVSQ